MLIPKQQINFDTIVTGNDLDLINYEKKFALTTSELPSVDLLHDITLYAHTFFVNDTGDPFKLTAYQDAISQCVHDFTEENPNRYILFKAANQIGKCINEGERLINGKGFPIRMKDIQIGETVISHKNGKCTYGVVTAKSDKIQKECYKIKTRSGKEIIISSDHKCLTPNGWHSINTGLIKHNYKTLVNTPFTEFKSMLKVPLKLPFIINNKLNQNEILCLAYLTTDGYIGNNDQSIKFTNNSQLLLDEFEACIPYFGVTIKKYAKNKGYDYLATGNIGCRNTELKQLLISQNVWCKKKDRSFPKDIFSLNDKNLGLFINRIFSCDGTLFTYKDRSKQNCRLSFYSPSLNYAKDLHYVLHRFGVHANIVTERPIKINATQNGYRVTIQNPNDILSFFDKVGLIFSKEDKSLECINIAKQRLLSNPINFKERYRDEDFFWDHITRIEPVGIKDCYDITVESEHNFICSGIVTHNSGLLCIKALFHVFNEDNINIIIVSNNLRNSQFVLAQIKQLLNTSMFSNSWREDLGDTANTTILTFVRDEGKVLNRIICAPAGEGILGFPVHYLFLDELDFYENAIQFFWGKALPRTNKTKGQIICFSNPNPEISRGNSILYSLWSGDFFKRKFSFNFLDAPWNTQAGLDVAKRNSPSYIFASTHMGEFSDEMGSFLSYREVQDMLKKDWDNTMFYTDQPVFISVDLGKMRDNTVICIGTTEDGHADDKLCNINVKYVNILPLKTTYKEIADELLRIVDYYETHCNGVSCMGYDATGQKTFGDFLGKLDSYATPVDFSRKESNKTKLCNDFKLMVEQRKLKVVFENEIERQLSNIDFKLTSSKKYTKVESKVESIHDDVFDSLLIMVYIAARINMIESGITILDDVSSSDPDLNNDPLLDDYEDTLILR